MQHVGENDDDDHDVQECVPAAASAVKTDSLFSDGRDNTKSGLSPNHHGEWPFLINSYGNTAPGRDFAPADE